MATNNVVPISSIVPRAPIIYNSKSGSLDYEGGRSAYANSCAAWRSAAREEAIQTLRLNPERDYIKPYTDMLEGRYYGRQHAKYRSRFFDNRLAEARLESLCSLTDLRPSMEISCSQPDVPQYERQAEILSSVIKAIWDQEDLDLKTEAVVDHAMFSVGYWKIGATMATASLPAKMLIIPCGMDMVLPIQPGFDFQDSSAVLYRVFKPLHRVKQAFGAAADNLEREVTGGYLQFVGGAYPDSLIPDYCFAPHALVQDSCGRISPISMFNESHFAIDSNGKPTKAKVILSSRRNEPTVELKTWGTFGSLPTTVEHKVLTPRGFVEAQAVQVGDFVRRPVREISAKQKTITVSEMRKVQSRFEVKDTAPTKPREDGKYPGAKDVKMKTTFDLGWLFGLYLAEGSIRSSGEMVGGLQFGINQDEESEFSAGIKRALGIYTHVHCYKHKNTQGAVLQVGQSSLGRFVSENFGCCDDKHIPDWVWICGKEFCRGIVCGYLEGDGHLKPKDNSIVAKSIRPAITFQIRELILSLGLGWAKIDYEPAGEYSGRNCHPTFILRTNSLVGLNLRKAMGWPHYQIHENSKTRAVEQSWRYSEDGKYLDVAVEEKTSGFSETFYDLSVESKCHDFLTIHGIAHNSMNAQNPAIRQQTSGRSGISMASEAGPFASVEVEEYWIDDPTINESSGTIQVKDPRLSLAQHNYHYRVPPGERLFPRKRLMVWVGSQIMYDGPAPYWHGLYPFSQLVLRPSVWRAGGLSVYRNLVPLQLAMNKVGAGVLDLCERAVDPQMAFRDGALDDTSYRNFFPDRHGATIKMHPTATWGTDAKYIDPAQLPQYVGSFIDRVDQAFSRQSGAMDVAGMTNKGQVSGGEVWEQVRDAVSTVKRLDARHVEPFMRASGTQMCSNIFQYWNRSTRMKILGKDGITWSDFDYDAGSMVPWSVEKEDHFRMFPVRIAAGSMHSGARDREKQLSVSLFRLGGTSRKDMLRTLGKGENQIAQIEKEIADEHAGDITPDAIGKGATPRLTRSARTGGV